MTDRKKGILLVLLAATMFSTSGLFIKAVNAGGMTVLFVRAAISGVAFIPFIQWKKIRFDRYYIGLILSYTLLTLCYVNATKLTTSANAIILQCTAPLWVYLYYLLTKKKTLNKWDLLPRLAILVGIAIILIDPLNIRGSDSIWGILLGIGAGIFYAVEQIFMEREYPFNDITKIGVINLVMSVLVFVVFWNKITFTSMAFRDWLMLAFLGIFQIGIPYALLFKGFRTVEAFEASILVMVEPILNPILVFIFLGEAPTLYTVAGYTFILVGVIVTIIPELRKKDGK